MAEQDNTAKPVAKQVRPVLPWWGKVLAGAMGVFVIAKFTPIMELATMFFYVVMVPMLFLASVGLISSGTFQAFTSGWANTVSEINRRVADKVKTVTARAA